MHNKCHDTFLFVQNHENERERHLPIFFGVRSEAPSHSTTRVAAAGGCNKFGALSDLHLFERLHALDSSDNDSCVVVLK